MGDFAAGPNFVAESGDSTVPSKRARLHDIDHDAGEAAVQEASPSPPPIGMSLTREEQSMFTCVSCFMIQPLEGLFIHSHDECDITEEKNICSVVTCSDCLHMMWLVHNNYARTSASIPCPGCRKFIWVDANGKFEIEPQPLLARFMKARRPTVVCPGDRCGAIVPYPDLKTHQNACSSCRYPCKIGCGEMLTYGQLASHSKVETSSCSPLG